MKNMKKAKKITAFLLCLVMAFAMAIPSYAAGEERGSITIDHAQENAKYTIYRILSLEQPASGKDFMYKATTVWESFINTPDTGGAYVEADENGYVTWKSGADVNAFIGAAEQYILDNSITDDGSKTAGTGDASIVFDDLPLGYYLIKSDSGCLCILDTTNKDIKVSEKNSTPTIDKKVQQGQTGTLGESNTANIGDTVNFQITVNAKPGAKNYVIHDKLSEGLTFTGIKEIRTTTGTKLTEGADYTVKTGEFDPAHDCSFEVAFEQSFLNKITADTTIIVTYSAVLNENAVVGTAGNDNEARMDYGDHHSTTIKTTKTYTYDFQLVKTDSGNKVLEGATFLLYRDKDCTQEVKLVQYGNVYRPAKAGETASNITAGNVKISGLAEGTYWLKETAAPGGYNKIEDPIQITVNGTLSDANVIDGIYQNGGVQVINQSGSTFPTTGGMGTTLFYVAGLALMTGAIVLFGLSRRRNGSAGK